MAESKQDMNRGGNESSRDKKNQIIAADQRIDGVDFEQMNFEQRRAPYNSGKRTLAEKEYDRNNKNNNPDRRRDDR